jgi:hypothetical protein
LRFAVYGVTLPSGHDCIGDGQAKGLQRLMRSVRDEHRKFFADAA